MKASDITLMGNGGSGFATEKFDGFVPFDRVTDLFDFNAQFSKVYVPSPDGGVAEVPNRRAVVHGDTGTVFNIVSGRYAIHQYRDVLLDNVSALLDTGKGDLGVIGAGLLDNGAVGWVQIAPSEGITVNNDTVEPTITVVSSHSGRFATSYRTGLFRLACSNQIGSLRRETRNAYTLKHTRNSVLRLADARQALALMFDTATEMTAEMQALMEQSVTDRQFLDIVERLNPKPVPTVTATGEVVPANEGSFTRWQNRTDDLWKMWRDDQRVGYRGTAWGALQTFSTYAQNDRPYRNMQTVNRASRNMGALLAGQIDRADRRVLAAVQMVTA